MKKYSTPLAIKEGNTSQNIPEIPSHPSQTGYYQNKIKQTITNTDKVLGGRGKEPHDGRSVNTQLAGM
jgi:hypothetical protein